MSQPKIKLSNIRIASPCSQKWEEMVGDEHVRFCSHNKPKRRYPQIRMGKVTFALLSCLRVSMSW